MAESSNMKTEDELVREQPFSTDITVHHRQDGYISISTSKKSAMGRRILLLKPEEYENLKEVVADE